MRFIQKLLCIIILSFLYLSLSAQQTLIKEYEKSYPTYDFSDPSPVPLLNQVYPYFRFDGFSDKAINKKWKVVCLENEYIKLEILPEIGGKIWTAFDKKANKPFLYNNHTVKFRDIAMRGPWTSGGLESNFGIIGHTPNCATPVDYIVQQEKDSSATCTIGAFDLLTRTHWRLKINVPKDKAYFTTEGYWYNPTELTQPYYHWMNAGIPVDGKLEYAFPGNSYIGHNGEYANWPINEENGKDISWYDNNDFGGPKSYHVFGKYNDFFGAYWHNKDFGMARYSLHGDKLGKKIWIWGLSRQGMIWEDLLTDTDGQYSEIQSGRLYNQTATLSAKTPFKHFGFEPEQTDSWVEYWYPIHSTKGISEANRFGAFNLSKEDGKLILHFSPIVPILDTIQILVKDSVIDKKFVQLQPLQTFKETINQTINKITIKIGHDIFELPLKNGQPDIQRPKNMVENIDFNKPSLLYQLGRNAIYEKEFTKAISLLDKSIQLDSNFIQPLNARAELYYRSMQYDSASILLSRALQLDTYNGETNYLWGITQLALGNIVDAKDGFDIASLTPAFRTKSAIALSKLCLKNKDLYQSELHAIKALNNNNQDITALQLLLTISRLNNDKTQFEKYATQIQNIDPLNHFVGFENAIYTHSKNTFKNFQSLIRNEMPFETYMEMAIWYFQIGRQKESIQLLNECKDKPEAQYWLAFLNNQTINCSSLNMQYSFPFRTETAHIIQQLLTKQSDWQLKYSLALIEHNLGNIRASQQLLKECANASNIAAFYAVRANIGIDQEHSNQLSDLIKAAELDNNWRYKKYLVEYYFDHKDIINGLKIAETYYTQHPTDYIMGMLYAKGLLLNSQYKACDKILSSIKVLPYEGATNGHELYKEAKLVQAVDAIAKKDYKNANQLIQQSKLWPENLGVGKPYDNDIDTRLEDWLTYQNTLLNKGISDNKLLLQITNFSPETSNTIRNFSMENNIITAWALEKVQNKNIATNWLLKQKENYPNDKELDSVLKCFKSNSTNSLPENSVTSRVLKRLSTISNQFAK